MIEGTDRIGLDGLAAGSVTAEAVGAAVKAAKMRREQRGTKVEKAVAVAAVPEQQTEKPAALKNGNAIKLSLSDLRAAAARRRQATGV
jgi:sRNA-binding protein